VLKFAVVFCCFGVLLLAPRVGLMLSLTKQVPQPLHYRRARSRLRLKVDALD